MYTVFVKSMATICLKECCKIWLRKYKDIRFDAREIFFNKKHGWGNAIQENRRISLTLPMIVVFSITIYTLAVFIIRVYFQSFCL